MQNKSQLGTLPTGRKTGGTINQLRGMPGPGPLGTAYTKPARSVGFLFGLQLPKVKKLSPAPSRGGETPNRFKDKVAARLFCGGSAKNDRYTKLVAVVQQRSVHGLNKRQARKDQPTKSKK